MTHTDLIARLRLKGIQPNEKPNHHIRRMEVERIEAANALTAAQEREKVLEEALRGLLLVMPKQNYHCENNEPALVLKARHIAGTAARAALDATDNT